MTILDERPAGQAGTTPPPSQPGRRRRAPPDRLRAAQRKEDPRFVRGKGHYVDDIVLPGMLHGAILRSPLAHARLVQSTRLRRWRIRRSSR